MSHDYKKHKLLRKISNFFGFKLVEKNFIKNMIDSEHISIDVERFVDKIIKENKLTKIIQVGSNDGITDDYVRKIIKKYNLKGVLLEPLPGSFKKLKENYKNINNIDLVNKALDRDNKVKKFYQVGDKYLNFYHQNISVLSSFNRDHLIKWGINTKHIESINVECVNWNNLFNDHDFLDVQIICVDTEGYDHVLINNLLSETKVRPVIVFEWVNISNSEFNKLLNLLKKENYEILKFKKDIICFRSNIII